MFRILQAPWCRGVVRRVRRGAGGSSEVRVALSTATTDSKADDVVPLSFTQVNSDGTNLPPFVILHGLFGSENNWRTLAHRFHQEENKRRRILSLSLRNHGNSPHTPNISVKLLAKDVLHFLDQHNLEKIVLMGHSLGGKAAMTAALMDPKRVRGLIVADVAPVEYKNDNQTWNQVRRALSAMSGLKLEELTSRVQADRLMAQQIPENSLRAFLLSNLVEDKGHKFKWRINLEAIKTNINTLSGFDYQELSSRVGSYPHPTLFIKGGKSDYIDEEKMKPVFDQVFARYSIVSIPNAGHWVHADAPNEFVQLVSKFLKQLSSSE